jgi:hypothetical protein
MNWTRACQNVKLKGDATYTYNFVVIITECTDAVGSNTQLHQFSNLVNYGTFVDSRTVKPDFYHPPLITNTHVRLVYSTKY